jgi:ABC-2 type transport system permease protein
LISVCIFGLIACVFTVLGLGIVFKIMGYKALSLLTFFKISLVLFLSNIALYVLQYIICFTFGNGISLGFGIVGTLLSPLLYLGLGEVIWKYIPCGYGIRISSYYFCKIVDVQTYANILQDFKTGITISSIILMTSIILFLVWSNNWQGSKYKNE